MIYPIRIPDPGRFELRLMDGSANPYLLQAGVLAAWLDMTPADADMFAIPDPDSLIQLPWKKEVGWLASDLWMNGKPVDASPRVMLKKQISRLEKNNMTLKSGVECEYFICNSCSFWIN